jgi:8-oxo-dGTP pyrophosphatase MutT (NUDIX family)
MSSIFQRVWFEYLQPLIGRPDRFQVAALCYRWKGETLEVLLIRSLHTRRWILPKGWPMKGRDAAEAAAAEAWEEAGAIVSRLDRSPVGTYRYKKVLRGGPEAPCETMVFPMEVTALAEEFPQQDRRERTWVTRDEAAAAVDEPGLKELLVSFEPPTDGD